VVLVRKLVHTCTDVNAVYDSDEERTARSLCEMMYTDELILMAESEEVCTRRLPSGNSTWKLNI